VTVLLRSEPRFRERRRARRRARWRPLVVAALAVTIAGGGVWAVLDSPVLRLTSVTVKGTSRLSVAEVKAAAAAPVGRSMVRVDPGLIRRRVAALPAVASVTVDRDWPHRLVVTIVERSPVARVHQGSDDELVDGSGHAFAAVPSAPSALVPLTLGAPVPGAGDADARAAMAVLAALRPPIRGQVASVTALSPVDVVLHLRGGRSVVWGGPGESARKAAVLAALMVTPAHSYDVSTPDVPVTR
jgi:cell division protein FtsQ